jgi:hypothetical protein
MSDLVTKSPKTRLVWRRRRLLSIALGVYLTALWCTFLWAVIEPSAIPVLLAFAGVTVGVMAAVPAVQWATQSTAVSKSNRDLVTKSRKERA